MEEHPFGASIPVQLREIRLCVCVPVSKSLYSSPGKKADWKYSRVLLYTASLSMDFADTRFLIGSKNSMYTDFIL